MTRLPCGCYCNSGGQLQLRTQHTFSRAFGLLLGRTQDTPRTGQDTPQQRTGQDTAPRHTQGVQGRARRGELRQHAPSRRLLWSRQEQVRQARSPDGAKRPESTHSLTNDQGGATTSPSGYAHACQEEFFLHARAATPASWPRRKQASADCSLWPLRDTPHRAPPHLFALVERENGTSSLRTSPSRAPAPRYLPPPVRAGTATSANL